MKDKIETVNNKKEGGGKVRLSIIVPIYNAERFIDSLKNNINAFVCGDKTVCEFILVDDGSKDSSFSLLQNIIGPQVHVYHKENGGIASARNFGVTKAKGKYIGFMDQDDFINPEALMKSLDRIDEEKGDFLVANFYTDDGRGKQEKKIIAQSGILEGKELKSVADEFLTTRCKPCPNIHKKYNFQRINPTVWNCLFSRKWITDNGIKFIKFLNFEDDYTFLVQSLYAAKKVLLEKNSFYTWLVHNDSTTFEDIYIEEYLTKRLQMDNWLYGLAIKAEIGMTALYSFQCYLFTHRLRGGYRNVCSHRNDSSFGQKRKELKMLVESKDKGVKIDFSNTNTPWSIREKIVLNLLNCHMFALALWCDIFYKVMKGRR